MRENRNLYIWFDCTFGVNPKGFQNLWGFLKKTDESLLVRRKFSMFGKERLGNLHIVWGTSGAQVLTWTRSVRLDLPIFMLFRWCIYRNLLL